MKKILFLSLALFAFFAAQAQEPAHVDESAARQSVAAWLETSNTLDQATVCGIPLGALNVIHESGAQVPVSACIEDAATSAAIVAGNRAANEYILNDDSVRFKAKFKIALVGAAIGALLMFIAFGFKETTDETA